MGTSLPAVAEVLNLLHAALRDTLKKVPNEALLFDNYGRLCLLVDEMIYEVSSCTQCLSL